MRKWFQRIPKKARIFASCAGTALLLGAGAFLLEKSNSATTGGQLSVDEQLAADEAMTDEEIVATAVQLLKMAEDWDVETQGCRHLLEGEEDDGTCPICYGDLEYVPVREAAEKDSENEDLSEGSVESSEAAGSEASNSEKEDNSSDTENLSLAVDGLKSETISDTERGGG